MNIFPLTNEGKYYQAKKQSISNLSFAKQFVAIFLKSSTYRANIYVKVSLGHNSEKKHIKD